MSSLGARWSSARVLILILLFVACDLYNFNNDFTPTGTPFNLNSGIKLIAIAGDRRHFTDNGLFTVAMVCRTTGSATVADTLPPGLLFTSRRNSTQHIIVLKEHRFTVGASNTTVIVGVFCCNRYRQIPTESDTFDLGPFTDNYELRQVADIVRNKNIANDLGLVQRAVWMITDSTGLNQAYIDSLNALPGESGS